jgi:2-polyprenyl-3-methyl-5-hydroxy-6-metoxy-1,4-benzoquinol methylase
MPFSKTSQISTIIEYIETLNPLSILDVGVGMGQYGFLSRIHLEHHNLFHIGENEITPRDRKEWRVRIDGIEGYKAYLNPVHDYCYNEIMIGDALKILPTLLDNSYDLILAIDIVEHFSQIEGLNFLSQLKRVAKKSALISTPKTFIPQDSNANPYENHRSLWEKADLIDNGFSKILDNDFCWIALYSLSES